MRNPVGQTLLRQFRVDAFVASGGMGAIYKVWDLKRNVYLAMKVLHADLADEPAILKRFQREARALKKLAHPNIVPFYGLYETSEYKFLLEAYVDGFSLKQLITTKRGQPFTITETLTYLKALSAALGYAHAHNVIHCDVKPGNVMIDGSGKVYLTDFGIARHAESTLTTLATSGTAAYMAPEQIRGDPVSAKTDIYALGVLVFELLTGKRPFRGDENGLLRVGSTTAEKIRYAHLNLQPPDPRQINPAVSFKLAQVILKALDKDPSQRFSSVLELYAAALETQTEAQQFISDQVPVPATFHLTNEVSEVPVKQSKLPNRTVWTVAMIIVLAIAAIVFWGLFSGDKGSLLAEITSTETPIEEILIVQQDDASKITETTPIETTTTLVNPTETASRTPLPTTTKAIAAPAISPLPKINTQVKPTYFPLNNCNASRLQVGDWAYIAFGGDRNAIRSKPDVGDKNNKIGFAEEGEVVTIIGGPACSYNWVVWEVQTAKGLKGWTPEGDENEFWLVPGNTWEPCPRFPASRLQPEQLAQVSQSPDVPNNVRQSPNKEADRLGQIMPGEVVKIREGPVCADGMIWWRVRSHSSNLTGWTAEGDTRNYWLVPVPQP